MSAFTEGQQAFRAGKTEADNPYTNGRTALGALRLTEEGVAWAEGFQSAKPARKLSEAELEAARSVDVSRFRRKSNRYYGG